ncbi:MAG: hypothetical protein ACWA5R_06885 [bacterium]
MWVSTTLADDVTLVAPSTEAAEGLDLQAVSALFQDAENLEVFEKKLNDPETGVNNLDLNEDGFVDYIRVVEEVVDQTHLIILQAALAKDEFQDLATIAVEKTQDDYQMQVQGNELIYGVDYYVTPRSVTIHTWPIITWIYRPYYHPYRSVYYFGYHPRWWRPFHPVHINVYHSRTKVLVKRNTFVIGHTNRVRTVHKFHYKPRTSRHVSHRVVVNKTTLRQSDPAGKSVTVKKGSRTVKQNGGHTKTVTKASKKTTVKKKGATKTRKVKVKKVKKKKV